LEIVPDDVHFNWLFSIPVFTGSDGSRSLGLASPQLYISTDEDWMFPGFIANSLLYVQPLAGNPFAANLLFAWNPPEIDLQGSGESIDPGAGSGSSPVPDAGSSFTLLAFAAIALAAIRRDGSVE